MIRWLVILLLCSLPAWAQSSIVTNFGGLSGAAETDIPPGLSLDIVDFDFRSSASSGAAALVRRDGYLRVGDIQTGLTAGPWRFSSGTISPQLLAGFGTELKLYSTSRDAWLGVGLHPFADTCSCRSGKDTLFSITNKNWWGPSIEAYTQIYIGDPRKVYAIEKILGDSLIILASGGTGGDTLPTFTNARIACTSVTTGSAGSSSVFTNAQDEKYAVMFEDTLHIITPWEKVKYGGASAMSVTSPLSFSSISAWNNDDATVTLSGAAGLDVGSWAQIGPKKNYNLNIALYVTAKTGNSNTFRADTAVWNWLFQNSDSLWWFKKISAPAWSRILAATVSTVAKESTLVYLEPVATYTQEVNLRGCNGVLGCTKPFFGRRTLAVKKRVYLFRWKVSNTSVVNAPENWPQDTLDYMTVFADNDTISTGRKQGLYDGQIPVTVGPAIAAETSLVITTVGYGGGSSTFYDSSYWKVSATKVGGTYSCATGTSDCIGTAFPDSFVTLWSSATDSVFANYSPARCPCVSSPCASNTSRVESLMVVCRPAYPPATVITLNGAHDCYEVGDSLFLYRMNRATRTALGNGTVIQDTAKGWDWGYCISTLGRFFCIDNQTRAAVGVGEKNRVYWSIPNNPDSFVVADFDAVFTDDGQIITTLAAEQNIIYIHKPTAIYTMPMTVSPDGLSVEPTGIFPTRSQYGALSPRGLVGTPYGWFFVGFNGVYQHNGGDSEMISREIRWFWRDSLEAAQIVNAAIVYDSHRDRLLVTVAGKNSTVNNITLVYDFTVRQWVRYNIGAHHFQVLSYPTNNPQLYWAEKTATTGGVYRMEEGLTTDLNVGIRPYFTTGWLTLSERLSERIDLQQWSLQNRRDASGLVALSVYIDGGTTARFVDTATATTGGYQLDLMRFPVGLGGNRFQFKVQSVAGDTCEITAFGVDYVPGGEVAPR